MSGRTGTHRPGSALSPRHHTLTVICVQRVDRRFLYMLHAYHCTRDGPLRMFRLIGCAAALTLASGCSSALGPDSSMRIPAVADKAGPSIVLYWPCLIDMPMPDVLKDRYTVRIDGKDVGEFTRCGFERYETTAGQHHVILVNKMFLDFAGAFGLDGAPYIVPRERSLYIKLTYFQYVEYHEMPADQAKIDIARMVKE